MVGAVLVMVIMLVVVMMLVLVNGDHAEGDHGGEW